MIVLFVGLPLAGKSTALREAEDLGFRVYASGDLAREELKKRGLKHTKENELKMGQLFHEGGEEMLVERILEKLGDVDFSKDKVAIDGLRSAKQIEALKKRTGIKPYVISINASFEVRLEREMKRKRFPDIDENYLKTRDETELKRGLKAMLDKADVTLDTTDMTIDEVRDQIKMILERLE